MAQWTVSTKEGRSYYMVLNPDQTFVCESDLIIVEDPSIDLSGMVLPFEIVVGSVTTI